MEFIKLNNILKLDNLNNVKIRFNLMFKDNWNPIETFNNNEIETILAGQYWNYNKNKSFKNGQITIGFIRIKSDENFWLLFHIGKITKDLNVLNGIGYKFKTLSEYKKYFGRLIITFKNTSQNMIRNAESVINDLFLEYDKVNISWDKMCRVLEKDNWKTALQNQKGVYLLTDTSNGKKYVGSAYGENMILSRWRAYVKNRQGGNIRLKQLDFDHIKRNFKYSILDIYKSTTDDQLILERENWWKEVLQSRKFGYNEN